MLDVSAGELIVGSYLRMIRECELVSYNQRSRKQGEQMEMDVLGVESDDVRKTVYGCEVVTHIRGMQYSGEPGSDDWSDYGNEMVQNTLEKLWSKFTADYELMKDLFPKADSYVLELWSPVVPEGDRTEGLQALDHRFEREHGVSIALVINGVYSDRVDELQEKASETKKRYDEPAFRFLQILESCRDDYPIAPPSEFN